SKRRKCDRQTKRECIIGKLPGQNLQYGVSIDVFTLQQTHLIISVEPDKVLGSDPRDRGQTVEEPGVQMLIWMEEVSLYVGCKPQKERRIDVIISFANIRVGMVQHVMLYLPDRCVGSDHVERVAQHLVDQWIFRISPVDGVVHHTHADSCHPKSTNDKTSEQLPGFGDESRDYGNYRHKIK